MTFPHQFLPTVAGPAGRIRVAVVALLTAWTILVPFLGPRGDELALGAPASLVVAPSPPPVWAAAAWPGPVPIAEIRPAVAPAAGPEPSGRGAPDPLAFAEMMGIDVPPGSRLEPGIGTTRCGTGRSQTCR